MAGKESKNLQSLGSDRDYGQLNSALGANIAIINRDGQVAI